jgi:hypothetical protein
VHAEDWPWVISTADVFEHEGQRPLSDVIWRFAGDRLVGRSWARRDGDLVGPRELMDLSWAYFKDVVKHETRFFFGELRNDLLSTGRGEPLRRGNAMLRWLGELINGFGLVHDLPQGHRLVRIRTHDRGVSPSAARELGTPPPRLAAAGRMNPAGIPVFYGADNHLTADFETEPSHYESGTLAVFETDATSRIVDLTKLPPVPSLFDESEHASRAALAFLAGFRDDVSAPVRVDDHARIDYVPTQVVGEYLRLAFRDNDGRPIDGVAWPSAQAAQGQCIVLFVGPGACYGDGERPPGERLGLRLIETRPLERCRSHA